MSDQEEQGQGAGEVRRFGRKDRKRRLDPRGPLFPPEPDPVEEARFAPPDLTPAAPPPPEVVPTPVVSEAYVPHPAERFPPLAQPAAESPERSAPTRTQSSRHAPPCLLNFITAIFVLGTIGALVLFVLITVNPYTPLNPFPPFTPLPIIITTTPLPPTATLSPTPGPTASFTPLALEAIDTPDSPFAFVLANDGALYIPNANGDGCNWSSIAGSVTDLTGAPLDGYGVRIVGDGLDQTIFSGSALTFGPGGFELFLNGAPQASNYTVQLFSPAELPLSAEYAVATLATCEQNVAIISFVQIKPL